jgi:capsular exopolysaccharide synthesis family protein
MIKGLNFMGSIWNIFGKKSNNHKGKSKLGLRMVEEGLITEEQLRAALKEQKGNPEMLGQILLAKGLVSEEQLQERLPEDNNIIAPKNLEELNSPEFSDLYRLQTQIKFALFSDRPLKTVLFTSGLPGEGKTVCSSFMGIITALALGKRVVLLDADLRRPSLHRFFHYYNAFGLTDVLIGSWPLEKAFRATKFRNLKVITSGSHATNPAQLLSSTAMEDLLGQLVRRFDYIFIDCSPVLIAPDSILLGPLAQGIILVAQHHQTRMKDLEKTLTKLERGGGNVLGVLLNRYAEPGKKKEYYEHYYNAPSR